MAESDPTVADVTGGMTDALLATMTGEPLTKAALTTTYALQTASGVVATSHGVTGDGSTDDTAALQSLFDAAPAGGTVILPPPGNGQSSYCIEGSLTVTTRNLRVLGAGRDIYAVNLKKTSGTGPIIAVKAPGFVLDGVGLVGNGAVNGEGATIAGLELFGDSNGNIDALIRGASFQYLSVGVHVRARNATIQENLFSNCLNGLVVDGTDAVYHTGLDADQNRGNTIRGNRFHNIGATRLNAGIQITSSARVLHALIDSNYFDSNGPPSILIQGSRSEETSTQNWAPMVTTSRMSTIRRFPEAISLETRLAATRDTALF